MIEQLPDKMPLEWDELEGFFTELCQRPIYSLNDLLLWLKDRSKLDSLIQEGFAWIYINASRDTASAEHRKNYEYFVTHIEPRLTPYHFQLNQKMLALNERWQLAEVPFGRMLKAAERGVHLYRSENIALETMMALDQHRFVEISGAMKIKQGDRELTMEQAAAFLNEPDRYLRKEIFELIAARRLQDKDSINAVFDKLLELRHQIARNAGFDDYRDYAHASLNRFDYTTRDVLAFHKAIEKHVVPIVRHHAALREKKMGVILEPYDMEVDPEGRPALKPFETGLVEKTSLMLSKMDPFFGECLDEMTAKGLFDVESRAGKAPGGYNYPLPETGAPFIFMNSTGTVRDLATMVHESGHAVHTFLMNPLQLGEFKNPPSETAELASMSMELVSMRHWKMFFDDPTLKRVVYERLLDALEALPWIATIDAFQHWLYTHPGHDVGERSAAWLAVFSRFGDGFSNWSNYPDYKTILWQKQLHLFEVPFYYIEYAIAGLGAISVWKNYENNPLATLIDFKAALSLGSTTSIKAVYERAGIKFNFSESYVEELAKFVEHQLELLSM